MKITGKLFIIILTAVSICLAVFFISIFPGLRRSRVEYRNEENWTSIAKGIDEYASKNNGRAPERLSELAEHGYVKSLKIFISPLDRRKISIRDYSDIDLKSSYLYNTNIIGQNLYELRRDNPHTPIVMERLENYKAELMTIVLYADGSIRQSQGEQLNKDLYLFKSRE